MRRSGRAHPRERSPDSLRLDVRAHARHRAGAANLHVRAGPGDARSARPRIRGLRRRRSLARVPGHRGDRVPRDPVLARPAPRGAVRAEAPAGRAGRVQSRYEPRGGSRGRAALGHAPARARDRRRHERRHRDDGPRRHAPGHLQRAQHRVRICARAHRLPLAVQSDDASLRAPRARGRRRVVDGQPRRHRLRQGARARRATSLRPQRRGRRGDRAARGPGRGLARAGTAAHGGRLRVPAQQERPGLPPG